MINFTEIHSLNKEHSLFGRYIHLTSIEPLLQKYNPEVIGTSVLSKPIYKLIIGNGKIKVFLWSQMHGNESTTTKALFDFINFLYSDSRDATSLLQEFTFCILPMVNPDGAHLYTRENANGVDLNRDAKNLSQPESILLRRTFDDFKPNFCYNLHDQRSIYGVGNNPKPATVSFLAPAFNFERDINEVRSKAINVIVEMNEELQKHIPNQVGRFDDSYNDNCIGDTFQGLGVPTILFEAGHYADDYYREYSRKMIFIALISGLNSIYENDIVNNKIDKYLNIPQNKIVFYDFLFKNIKINYDNKDLITNFAVQYEEELVNGEIQFLAKIAEVGVLKGFEGHYQFNAHKMKYEDDYDNIPKINKKANFIIGDIKFINAKKQNKTN